MKNRYHLSVENISVDYYFGNDFLDSINGDHCHDKYEISYLVSGSGSYNVEGSEHKITRGTVMLINPMSYHKVDLECKDDIELYTVCFDKDVLSPAVKALIDKVTESSDGRGSIFPPRLVCDELSGSFERFCVAKKLNEAESEAYINALLTEIVILLSAAEGERIISSGEELGARVVAYLNQNIEKKIGLDKLARRFFVSKYYLCRAFKNYSGISLHAYVNQKRIMYAHQLIKSGVTASEAAEKVGFGDYSAFYRAYVKILGKSPTAE